MIYGMEIISFDLIRKLSHSYYKFYLTGSRYFGFSEADSDWDFFTGDTPGVIDYLKVSGFTRISMKPEWLGQNTVGIWKHDCKVEIAVQKDVEMKKKAQEYLKENLIPRLKAAERFKRNEIWDIAYENCLE